MADVTLRVSTNWSERLLHRFDLVLDRLEQAFGSALADKHGDFHEAAHVTHIRRLAARGCNGQALI
ncbi:hypothetical protein [Dongia deserti]|uniref:hypothetical protein n=1 Tax=Dongia deserti TaxID=2268030 RepID=UPI000E64FE68|nr:hypothetical protein [Dongia deserti]